MAIASILFDLRAGIAKLDADFKKATRTIDKRLKGIDGMFKKAAGAFALYFSGRALTGMVKGVLDTGDALTNLTNRTGISAEALQELRFAGETLGVSLGEMDASLQRFNRRMGAAVSGNAAMADAFRRAGLQIRDTSGAVKSAEDLFYEFADAMAALPTDAQRASHAMNLLGDSGLKMVPLLKEGSAGLRALGDEARALGGVMSDEAVAASNRFLTAMGKLRTAGKGVTTAVVSALLPAFEGIANAALGAATGQERFQRITDVTTRAVTWMADALDKALAFLRMLIDPLVATATGMSEAEVATLGFGSALAALGSAINGAAKDSGALGFVLRTMQSGLLSIRGHIEALMVALPAFGRAVKAGLSGSLSEARSIIEESDAQIARIVERTNDQINRIWDESLQPLEFVGGAVGSFRRALEEAREASASLAGSVRGQLGPVLGVAEAGAEAAARAAEQLAAKIREAGFATRDLVAQAADDRIAQLEVALERDLAALDAALAAGEILQEDYEAQRQARQQIFEQERTQILRDAERERIDIEMDTMAIEVGLLDDRIEQLRFAHERELEELRRLEEDKILTAEEAMRRREALEARHTKEMQAEMEAQARESQAVGLSIADAIGQGLKQGFTSRNFRDIFKSLLTIFSRIASIIPGGQLLGGISGLFAGLFADGGLIKGIGGPTDDRNLALVSDGEFVTRAASVRKFGARFFERLNEGFLDLSALNRFADGGMVGGSHGMTPAMVGGPPAPTQINYIQAMDPSSAVEAVSRVTGPAMYRRGLSHADSMELALNRRRLAPRSGRL